MLGVDPNAAFAARAAEAADAAGVELELVNATAESLPFASASADVVVSTFCLCSVRSPHAVLAEAARVLRPGGRLLLLEHVSAAAGTPLARKQRALDPLQQALAGNCHLTRRTGALLAELSASVACTGEAFACEPDGVPSAPDAPGGAHPFEACEVAGFFVPGGDLIAPHVTAAAVRA